MYWAFPSSPTPYTLTGLSRLKNSKQQTQKKPEPRLKKPGFGLRTLCKIRGSHFGMDRGSLIPLTSTPLNSFHPEAALLRNLCVNLRPCLCDVRCTSPRKALISLTLRKMSRFPYENCAISIHSFRMETKYICASKQFSGWEKWGGFSATDQTIA